jgi:hypothetical protein
VITIWSCIEGDPLHDITGERLNNGGFTLDTLYAISDTSIVEGKISTAFSGKLLLGSYSNFEARVLVRFLNVPADTFQIDSLRLILNSVYNQGEASIPIRGTAYMVTKDWEESVNQDESWKWQENIDISSETSSNFEIDSETEGSHIIELSPQLMKTWQDTTGGGNNFGLLLNFNTASYIKEFGSRNNSDNIPVPRLVAIYYNHSLDSTMHDTLFSDKDASLIDFNGKFDPGLLQIVSGYSVKSFLKFDLSSIPKNAALATMRFILHRDVENSLINTNLGEQMYLRTATSDYELLPDYEIDSTFVFNVSYNVILSEQLPNILDISPGDRGNISQNFLQSIVNDWISFGSFMVQYRNEWDGISVYALKDSESADQIQRPKIIVEYYNIPSPRL